MYSINILNSCSNKLYNKLKRGILASSNSITQFLS